MTPVIFRKFKKDGDIIALFPNEKWDYCGLHIASYMRIGQHGEADYTGVIGITVPATEKEYRSLLLELISIGYDDLKIMKRRINPCVTA